MPESCTEWLSLDPESADYLAIGRSMDRKLIERGWYTLHWPKEYGGAGGDPVRHAILRELGGYFRVATYGGQGRYIVGPALIAFGTEEQKRKYLPPIARGEMVICLGYTEANAGSDLAAMEIKAVPDGDAVIVTGSKLYITYGHYANTMLLAARTDPQGPRYKNVSLFLADMTLPGVRVSPLPCLTGLQVNEVHFDDVRVPKDCLLGEPNRGFYHMAVALNFERTGVDWPARYMAQLEDVVEHCRRTGSWAQPRVRRLVGEVATRLEAWRIVCWRVVQLQARGEVPSWEASMTRACTARTPTRCSVARCWRIPRTGRPARTRRPPCRAARPGRVVPARILQQPWPGRTLCHAQRYHAPRPEPAEELREIRRWMLPGFGSTRCR